VQRRHADVSDERAEHVPRVPDHADRDGGADVLHRRRRLRRGRRRVPTHGGAAVMMGASLTIAPRERRVASLRDRAAAHGAGASLQCEPTRSDAAWRAPAIPDTARRSHQYETASPRCHDTRDAHSIRAMRKPHRIHVRNRSLATAVCSGGHRATRVARSPVTAVRAGSRMPSASLTIAIPGPIPRAPAWHPPCFVDHHQTPIPPCVSRRCIDLAARAALDSEHRERTPLRRPRAAARRPNRKKDLVPCAQIDSAS